MLSNIEAVEDLRSLARAKGKDYITKTINLSLVEDALLEGWIVEKKNEKSVRLKKKKEGSLDLTDRVWSLLYSIGFTHLNNDKVLLTPEPKDVQSQTLTIDVVGVDDEVGIAIECKAVEDVSQFRQELDRFILIRQRFAYAINQQFAQPFDRQVKRQVALAMFTSKISLSEDDKKRAKDGNVTLFDENDLVYYESLASHLGPAARYQFLADALPGKIIPGLNMRVPAIKTRMGGYTCYTFSISPEYLLKISYVSHRSKGRGSDVSTYQRMIQKSRLQNIRKYISEENGIFPTNIVINFDRKPNFDRREQETEQDSAILGWLDIRSAYKSAWIIDGQHRLFAYSGHETAKKAKLSVLAFEALPASKQAELFIDINGEQKSVKKSLLQELYADLHKNAKEPEIRVQSIISQAIQSLDADPKSPFYQRIQTADEKKDEIRCISLTSMFRALASDLYFSSIKRGNITNYGPLWSEVSSDATLKRTVYIIQSWFDVIQSFVPEWWDAGAGEGGGLSMNDSVTACINVLRSVFQHLSTHGEKLDSLSDEELNKQIHPYAVALGKYLSSLSDDERRNYRAYRGGQGQTIRTKRCQQAIHEMIPEFNPSGLREFIEEQKAQTNLKAKVIIDRIEQLLQKTVLEELKREFGPEETQWWVEGIPKQIRTKVSQRYEEDDAKRGDKEYYFDLIDYRTIVQNHWDIFGKLLGYGKANISKDKRTAWIGEINESRRIVAHSSSGKSVTFEQLAQLEDYEEWLNKQVQQVSEDTTEDVLTESA